MAEPTGVMSKLNDEELLESLAGGFALPSDWYTDEALFLKERDRVLRRGWHYAMHTDGLPTSGRAIIEVAGAPLVLVRDDDGILRGFVNICRHRAHPLVSDEGIHRELRCQHDAWEYDLEGRLRSTPDTSGQDLEQDQLHLVPVLTAVWGPTVWVNVDLSAPPFFDYVAGLPSLVASHGVDVDAHTLAFVDEWEIGANWKVFLDNAIECYHCPTCHPALSQVLEMDPALHELSIGGRYWISHKVPLRQSAVGTDVAVPSARASADQLFYHFHWIFPTTYFQYAGAGFDIGTIGVSGVNSIRFRHLTFLPNDMTEDEIAERRRRLDADPTVSEDVAICERVQSAHEAGFAPPGRLLPRSEWLLQHFQRVIVESLTFTH